MAEIDAWLAENYDGLVADEGRNITYESLAVTADQRNAPELAAWARKRAARTKDVTPKAAVPVEKSTRTKK